MFSVYLSGRINAGFDWIAVPKSAISIPPIKHFKPADFQQETKLTLKPAEAGKTGKQRLETVFINIHNKSSEFEPLSSKCTRTTAEIDVMDPKKITIQDIADCANVSKSTVSRVLNNTTPVNDKKREAVMRAVKDLDFEPNSLASGLAGGNSMIIGVQTQKIGSPFYDLVTRGVIHCLTDTRYSPILVDGVWNREIELKGIDTLLRRQIDGLIIIGGDIEKDHLLRLAAKKPLLLVGREVEGLQDRCLYVDNFDIGYQATKFLIDLGHRKIVHITGIKAHQDSVRRLNGYLHALEEAKIPYDEELVYEGAFDGPSGVKAIDTIISRGKQFTAVFAANDMSAFGARLALYRHGIDVPNEVSLIGIDDQTEAPYMTPPMTSVRQPAFKMGVAAGNAMLDLLMNKEIELPKPTVQISVRESTAKIDN